jgi:hypothetical protein
MLVAQSPERVFGGAVGRIDRRQYRRRVSSIKRLNRRIPAEL